MPSFINQHDPRAPFSQDELRDIREMLAQWKSWQSSRGVAEEQKVCSGYAQPISEPSHELPEGDELRDRIEDPLVSGDLDATHENHSET